MTQVAILDDKLQASIDTTKKQMDALTTDFKKRLSASEQKFDAAIQSIEARLQSSPPPSLPSGANGSDGFSIAEELQGKITSIEEQLKSLSRAPSTAAPSVAESAFGAPSSAQLADPCRRWITGFPRPVLKIHREAHFTKLKEAMGVHLSASAVPKYQAASAASYAITFASQALAREFSEWSATPGAIPSFKDPRDNTLHGMRARPDKPYDVRMKQRLLSRLWEPVGQSLAKLALPEGSLQRHVNG